MLGSLSENAGSTCSARDRVEYRFRRLLQGDSAAAERSQSLASRMCSALQVFCEAGLGRFGGAH